MKFEYEFQTHEAIVWRKFVLIEADSLEEAKALVKKNGVGDLEERWIEVRHEEEEDQDNDPMDEQNWVEVL